MLEKDKALDIFNQTNKYQNTQMKKTNPTGIVPMRIANVQQTKSTIIHSWVELQRWSVASGLAVGVVVADG